MNPNLSTKSAMTVHELIAELQKISNKSMQVHVVNLYVTQERLQEVRINGEGSGAHIILCAQARNGVTQ